jgi:chitodextrinase
MANVSGKVTTPFTYKGKKYEVGDEVTMDATHAPKHEKLNYVKFNREAEAKIDKVSDKKSK